MTYNQRKSICKWAEHKTQHRNKGPIEFRSSKDGNQNERDKGLKGMICKLLSQQYAPNVDIGMFDGAVV